MRSAYAFVLWERLGEVAGARRVSDLPAGVVRSGTSVLIHPQVAPLAEQVRTLIHLRLA